VLPVFAARVNESAQGQDTLLGRYLWDIINDSQTVAWQNVNTSETTNWQVISTAL
jgi:hypothetical protein